MVAKLKAKNVELIAKSNSDYWCPHCRVYMVWPQVTCDETHIVCGKPVVWVSKGKEPPDDA